MNVSILNDNIIELSETFFAHLTLVSEKCESDTIRLSPNVIKVDIKDEDSKNICLHPFYTYMNFLRTAYKLDTLG